VAELCTTIEARLRAQLEAVAAGDDVPPGQALRLEGLCEAAVLVGSLSPSQLDELLETLHEEILGEGLRERLGPDWRTFHPFPELPIHMQRAPVTPSTAS